MSIVVIERPEPFLGVEEAKAHLKVEGVAEDALIGRYIAAVCRHLDGPNTWLGYAVNPQLVEVRGPDWALNPLPCAPVLEVQSITYVASDGVERVLDVEAYEQTSRGVIVRRPPGLRGDAEGVRLLARLGHEGTGAVPDDIVVAALMMVADLYAGREPDREEGRVAIPDRAEALLQPYQNWSR